MIWEINTNSPVDIPPAEYYLQSAATLDEQTFYSGIHIFS